MDHDGQVWRPRGPVLIVGAVAALAFGAVAVVFALIAAEGHGQTPFAAAVAALLSAGIAVVGAGFPLRYRVELRDGELAVTGLVRTWRAPVQQITRSRYRRSGVAFDLADGRSLRCRGLEIGLFDSWLRDGNLCTEVLRVVGAAAKAAQEQNPPAPADEAVVRWNLKRRRKAVQVRFALFLLVVALGTYSEFVLNDDSSGSTSPAHGATTPPGPTVTLGECMQDPATDADALTPILCTSPHTAQVYSIAETASGQGCDDGLLLTAALPQIHSDETLFAVIGGTPQTVCLIVTSSLTRSVVRGH